MHVINAILKKKIITSACAIAFYVELTSLFLIFILAQGFFFSSTNPKYLKSRINNISVFIRRIARMDVLNVCVITRLILKKFALF